MGRRSCLVINGLSEYFLLCFCSQDKPMRMNQMIRNRGYEGS